MKLYFAPPRLDQMFSDAFSKDHQLIRADPKRSLYLACALMIRGNVQVSDLRRNIERSEHRSLLPSVLNAIVSCDNPPPHPPPVKKKKYYSSVLLLRIHDWLLSAPSLPSPQTLISCRATPTFALKGRVCLASA